MVGRRPERERERPRRERREGDEAETEGEDEGLDPTVREVKWSSLPEGLKVAPKPKALDNSLVDKLLFSFAGSRRTAG